MVEHLAPEHLTPAASLNRVRLVDLPGVALPKEVRGRTAHQLLSAEALAALARRHGEALGLASEETAAPPAFLRRFDRCYIDARRAVRDAAEDVARASGERLGYLILALRRGDAANRAARPDWDESYWAHWAAIRAISLGGGVVSGHLGPRLVAHAARTMLAAGMADCELRVAPWPALLPLIGAARSVPPGGQAALVFDFGQSFVKRAVARYDGEALAGLRLLPPVPSRWTTPAPDTVLAPEQVERLGEHLVAVMAATWREAGDDAPALTPVLGVSIASYVRDGQPLPRQGGPHAALHTLAPNLARWLAGRLGARLGRAVELLLIHDGTAAGRAIAGGEEAAVIMLGTALGSGFPPRDRAQRPVAQPLAVQ